jgi:hypothetical protein
MIPASDINDVIKKADAILNNSNATITTIPGRVF